MFDSDRFRNNGSGNWVDWKDVSTGSYDGDFTMINLTDKAWETLQTGKTEFTEGVHTFN